MSEVSLYAEVLPPDHREEIKGDTSSPLLSQLIQPAWTFQDWIQDSVLNPTPYTLHPKPKPPDHREEIAMRRVDAMGPDVYEP